MKMMLPRLCLIAILAGVFSGCASRSSTPTQARTPPASAGSKAPATAPQSGGYYLDDGPGVNPPSNLDRIADAVPRDEPLHRGANKPYTVLGRSYVPNVAVTSFQQTGMASWYGRKYHGQKTSIGETYDMYAMTAAHPTLPLPSYVRVTNQRNGKAVVVRVNDRGPFLQDRVIDLSYVAAYKLDYLQQGSAMVMVERVFAGDTPPIRQDISTPSARASLSVAAPAPIPSNNIVSNTISAEEGRIYLQLGAFASMENAENFRVRVNAAMSNATEWDKESVGVLQKEGLVRVRIGPFASAVQAEALAKRIRETLQLTPIISTR